MGSPEKAKSLFSGGYLCSQSVLSTYSEEFGVPPHTALRIAAAFGGGINNSGEMCGAVSGALMLIGLKYGSTQPRDAEGRQRVESAADRFISDFAGAYGSMKCRDLLGIDISTDDGLQQARQSGVFETRCPLFVESAAAFVQAILAEE